MLPRLKFRLGGGRQQVISVFYHSLQVAEKQAYVKAKYWLSTCEATPGQNVKLGDVSPSHS